MRHQYSHAVDIVPTLYEALGIELPDVVNGYTQKPLEGVSFAATLRRRRRPTTGKETQFYSMLGTRAIWHKGWKAATAVPAAPDVVGRLPPAALGAVRHRRSTRASATTSPASTRTSCRS